MTGQEIWPEDRGAKGCGRQVPEHLAVSPEVAHLAPGAAQSQEPRGWEKGLREGSFPCEWSQSTPPPPASFQGWKWAVPHAVGGGGRRRTLSPPPAFCELGPPAHWDWVGVKGLSWAACRWEGRAW